MVPLPPDLAARIGPAAWIEETIGESPARTFRLEAASDSRDSHVGAVSYLKVAPKRGQRLQDEAERLRWLDGRLPVPHVLAIREEAEREILWMTAVPGANATDSRWQARPDAVMRSLARGLRTIHAIDIADCPFDRRLAVAIGEARENVRLDLVDETDFDRSRLGQSASDVLREVGAARPAGEDLVFTHGDFTMPNVVLDDALRCSFVDLGRAGIADRHQDLALAVRSIIRNYGAEWCAPFLAEYGMPEPDAAKVVFYQMLDELM